MRHPVSFKIPTPKEHAEATLKSREAACKWNTLALPPRPELTSPVSVRVQFYSHVSKIHRKMVPDMEGTVELDEHGDLNTRLVQQLWGLENCIPVHPVNLTPMWSLESSYRAHDLIKYSTVRQLLKHRKYLMFIEPQPLSTETSRNRAIRESWINFLGAFVILSSLVSDILSDTRACLTYLAVYAFFNLTPIPLSYRRLCATRAWVDARYPKGLLVTFRLYLADVGRLAHRKFNPLVPWYKSGQLIYQVSPFRRPIRYAMHMMGRPNLGVWDVVGLMLVFVLTFVLVFYGSVHGVFTP